MWRIVAGLSSVTAVTGLVVGWPLVGSIAGILLLLTLLTLTARASFVRVPELSAAVVYNRERQAFSRLLPAGSHWLVPFAEQVQAVIPLGGEVASGACQAYTNGGVPLTVRWQAAYQMEPFALSADTQAKLALKLARKSRMIAQSHVNNCLQRVMSNYEINEVFVAGARGRLEREVRQAAAVQLAALGVVVQRVVIESLEMPAQIQSTLAAAHERAVQAESEARALAYLQKIISQFSDTDMQRLAELERMRILGQNGVSLLYPIAAAQPTFPAPPTAPARAGRRQRADGLTAAEWLTHQQTPAAN